MSEKVSRKTTLKGHALRLGQGVSQHKMIPN